MMAQRSCQRTAGGWTDDRLTFDTRGSEYIFYSDPQLASVAVRRRGRFPCVSS